jgi:glycosyltransferase involved in cell wall biosynthesis
MKIAHFSPLPPQPSGVADYSAALLPHLAERMSVDAFVDSPGLPIPGVNVRPVSDFLDSSEARRQYDVCLYHMGNHPAYHEWIYETLTHYPGITLLHESDLHAFHWNRAHPDERRAEYVREMGYAYGREGTREARLICTGKRELPVGSRPLFHRIADISLGLIVHTEYARQCILSESPHARIVCIPHAVAVPQAPTAQRPEVVWHFPPEAVILASFGFVAPSKLIETTLHAVAQLRSEMPNLRYLIVGEPVAGYDLLPLIRELDLADVVRLTGYVDDAEFRAYLGAIDIGIALRAEPTGGEISGAAVRLMASGRATIMSDVGGFAEFPDGCVIKIRPGDDEIEQVVAAIRRLATDSHARAAYGQAAQRYVQQEFSFPRVAQQYEQFIHECLEPLVP